MQAAEGLQMLSETDATFEFFSHQAPENEPFSPDTVVDWDGKPGGTRVETLELEDFLKPMLHPHPDAAPAQKTKAAQFNGLVRALRAHLQEPKAYKVSDVSMPVYLIGKTDSGDYAGLKTLVVHT